MEQEVTQVEAQVDDSSVSETVQVDATVEQNIEEERLTYKQKVGALESQMSSLQKELEDARKSLNDAIGEGKLYKGAAKLGLVDEEGFELAKHFYVKTDKSLEFDSWLSQSISNGTLPKGLVPYISQPGSPIPAPPPQSKPPTVQNNTTSQRASEQERLDLVKRANSPHTTPEERIRIINTIKSNRA